MLTATIRYYGSINPELVVASIGTGSTIIDSQEFKVSRYANYDELTDCIIDYVSQFNVHEFNNDPVLLPHDCRIGVNQIN